MIATAVVVSVAAYGLAFAAPIRTLAIQAVLVLGFLAALLSIGRALSRQS